jgi:uncharacterized protein YjiS (DUF1127 family)
MTVIRFEDVHPATAGARRVFARRAPVDAGARVLAKLGLWRRRKRDRARLADLDDRMLADIGISRPEAEFLANKPFWRE